MEKLRKVALTINNVCNLKCPHCYLQYIDNGNNMISEEVLQKVFLIKDLEVLIVVGMEPFYNRTSVAFLKRIAEHFSSQGANVNVISNGLNLNLADDELFQKLSVLDISMDGGEQSYKHYRGGSYEKIMRNLKHVKSVNSSLALNCLNVINKQTIGQLDEILDIQADFTKVYFSPYMETLNQGVVAVDKISVPEILKLLAGSKRFLDDDRATFSFGLGHIAGCSNFPHEVVETDLEVRGFIKNNFPPGKVTYPKESLKQGLLRITYDGKMMDPYYALHTSLYTEKAVSLFGELSPEVFFDQCYQQRELEGWSKSSDSRFLQRYFKS